MGVEGSQSQEQGVLSALRAELNTLNARVCDMRTRPIVAMPIDLINQLHSSINNLYSYNKTLTNRIAMAENRIVLLEQRYPVYYQQGGAVTNKTYSYNKS